VVGHEAKLRLRCGPPHRDFGANPLPGAPYVSRCDHLRPGEDPLRAAEAGDPYRDTSRTAGSAERKEVAGRRVVVAERAVERIGRRHPSVAEGDRGVAGGAGERPVGDHRRPDRPAVLVDDPTLGVGADGLRAIDAFERHENQSR
jgi:hypothetical protein